MRQGWVLIAVLFLTTFLARPSSAWNDAGHMTVARIAWNNLPPVDREAAVAILRQHPHYKQLLLKDRHADASEAEWVFLRAAVWSDHVRPPRATSRHELQTHPIYRFHRASWHFVNFPYRAGQNATALPAEPIRGEEESGTHILEQLDSSIRLLIDHSANDPDHVPGTTREQNRAVRLCWLMHLVGDLHQPLHVTTLIDESRFPTGTHSDEGGNLLLIRTHDGAAPHSLHAFWDERLGTNSHFSAVCDLAEILVRDPHLTPTQLLELTQDRQIRQWAAEGYQYAKATVYHDGRLQAARAIDFEHHLITENDVPILPQEAVSAAGNVARRRIVVAGHRLAGLLRQILERQ